MAYPTTAITFSAKVAGDTIQPADVNTLQTEVAALEAALLTSGLAHNLNPSADSTRLLGSSAARWIIHGSQVTDGTLPLTALSSGTLSTTISVPGPSHPGCRVTNSANLELTNTGDYQGLSWDTELFDDGDIHSTAANSSRITFGSSGVWLIGAVVTWIPSTVGTYRTLRVLLNDTTVLASQGEDQISYSQTVNTIWRATSTSDYVTVQVAHNIGSTASLNTSTGAGGSGFWAHRLAD